MRRSVQIAATALALHACSRQESGESRAPVAGTPPQRAALAETPPPDQREAAPLDERREARERLVSRIAERGIENQAVLAAMRKVPRHAFVPDAWSDNAYEDRPLPIGHGQTISQPT